MLTLVLMLSFVMSSLEVNQIEDRKNFLYTQANIISNQMITEFENLSLPNTREYYYNIVSDFSKEINSRVMVFDRHGSVLIDAYKEYTEQDSISNKEIDQAFKGEPASSIYDSPSFGRIMYVAVPVESDGAIVGAILLTSSLEDIYTSQDTLLRNLFLLALVCIGFTGATSFIFVEILSSPIEKLTETVNRVAFGKHDERIRLEGSDEIKVLSNSFNSMMVRLDQVDNQRKQFVANVSHELRTPLTSIKILSSSLITDESTDPGIYKEFLKDIDMEVDRLNGIINSLLYLVDLEKKELELNYTNSTLNSLIPKVIQMLVPLANQKNIKVDFQADEKVWATFDREKIHQCLSNLIANAIKYNEPGGHVIVRLINRRNTFAIRVIDDGIGIKEEELPFIFDRFYRADKARNRKTGGTGLGLSIVQQIIQLHQGDIRVESTINQGTSIEIEIPKGLA
ncbi:MAG: HAMP domain-containing protein [Clostridia bacterium]|nr:HAMP domain-containing protein [Clostridia bacterium]